MPTNDPRHSRRVAVLLAGLYCASVFSPLPLEGVENPVLSISEPARSSTAIHFTEHLIADGFSYPYGIAAADLDGDGDLDLTSAASSWILGNQFAWFENDGTPEDGEWTKHGSYEFRWWRNEGCDPGNGTPAAEPTIAANGDGADVWPTLPMADATVRIPAPRSPH